MASSLEEEEDGLEDVHYKLIAIADHQDSEI